MLDFIENRLKESTQKIEKEAFKLFADCKRLEVNESRIHEILDATSAFLTETMKKLKE